MTVVSCTLVNVVALDPEVYGHHVVYIVATPLTVVKYVDMENDGITVEIEDPLVYSDELWELIVVSTADEVVEGMTTCDEVKGTEERGVNGL